MPNSHDAMFHNPLEVSMYTDADSMHIYFSNDDLVNWKDIEGDGTAIGTVSNAPGANLFPVNNFSEVDKILLENNITHIYILQI